MEYFVVVWFCLFGDCGAGWVNQSFTDMNTCSAYSNVYSLELQKRVPESSGEIYCVSKSVLEDAKQQFPMVQLQKLEDLPSIK